MARGEDIKTPQAIIAFARDLFKLRLRDDGADKYGCTLLFDKSVDISALQDAALNVAVAEWGEKARGMIENGVIKNPFLDGDGPQGVSKKTGQRHPGFTGRRFIRCSSGAEFKPKVFDRRRNPVYEVELCNSGSKVFAVINPYTWENDKNGRGISFGISIVQVVQNAEGADILGGSGGPDPDEWLDVLDDPGEAPAETRGSAGAGGLFS